LWKGKSVYRFLFIKRGKSGQYRAPYFLTGRAVEKQYRKCHRKENYPELDEGKR